MAAKVPIRAVFDGSTATGLAEFQSTEFIALAYGGLGASLSIGSAGQVLKVNSGADALEFGAVEAILNIDGMTNGSSITIVDADKFAISDGGTEKYVLASQIKTYAAAALDDISTGDAASTLQTSSGAITIDSNAAAVTVDGHTGVTLQSTNSGNILLDSVADIVLDAGGADVTLKDDGTVYGSLTQSGGELLIKSGSTPTTALTLAGANATLAGTLGVGAITGTSTIQGTTITATTAFVPDASDGAALGTSALEFSDLFLADGAVINFGDDQDITLTHSADAGLTTNGTFQATTITATTAVVPDASDGAALGTTSLEWSDLYLADGAVLGFGDDQDVTLTHVADAGLTTNGTFQATTITATTAFVPDASDGASLGTTALEFSNLYLADAASIYFGADQDITLTHVADTGLTTNGTFQATTITATTAVVPDASDGAALGTTSLEWSDLYLADGAVLGFGDDQDVTLTHVHNTGILLNSTMAIQFNDSSQYINAPSNAILDINATDEVEVNATLMDVNANLDVSGTIVGASTLSATTITASTAVVPDASDGAALGTTSLEWSDLYLADGAVLGFGDDQDVTLTHVADAGLLLNSSMYVTFRDSALKIYSSADGQLDIDADTEVEITATTVDLNGNLDVSGTYTGGGLMTTGGNIVIPNDGNIGSVGDTDSIAIDTSGNVTASQNLTVTGNFTVNGTTTTVATTNMVVKDNMIELNNGATSNANDSGIVIERGSTGDNAIIHWDESADKFQVGTTTATGSSTGNLTVTTGTLVANVEGSGAGLSAGTTPLTTLDIDGGTDIGAAIADADLFVVDDGAGGTNRKVAASRLKTYIDAAAEATAIAIALG